MSTRNGKDLEIDPLATLFPPMARGDPIGPGSLPAVARVASVVLGGHPRSTQRHAGPQPGPNRS
jgi:hypothetical protein